MWRLAKWLLVGLSLVFIQSYSNGYYGVLFWPGGDKMWSWDWSNSATWTPDSIFTTWRSSAGLLKWGKYKTRVEVNCMNPFSNHWILSHSIVHRWKLTHCMHTSHIWSHVIRMRVLWSSFVFRNVCRSSHYFSRSFPPRNMSLQSFRYAGHAIIDMPLAWMGRSTSVCHQRLSV